MQEILISIQRPHTDNIKAFIKRIEVRKSKPKQTTPFVCYIYESKVKGGCGKVIGEFVCRGIMQPFDNLRRMAKESCLTEEELITYSKGKPLYGWRITDLKIYDKPKKLNEFYRPCRSVITRPPRSWCYVETQRD